MTSTIIRLPFLRPCEKSVQSEKMRYFNPGLSDQISFSVYKFTPQMPYSTKIAESLLQEMAINSSEREDCLINGLNRDNIRQDIGIRQEMEALNAFANKISSDTGNYNYYLEFAQKMLLWRWHTEQLWEEIESLEKKIRKQESVLRQNFEDFPFEDASSPENNFDRQDTGWKKVTENALFFLPPNIDIFAEQEMARHLIEYLNFKSVKEHESLCELGNGYMYVNCPAWQALGYVTEERFNFLRPYPALAENFLKNRNWIIYDK